MRCCAWFVLPCLVVLLSACSSALRWSPDTHVVRPGETLYAIAFTYGLDHRDLAAWNRLGDGELIYPGQRLRLTGSPVRAAKRAPQPTATRPAPGMTGKTPTPAARPTPVVKPVDQWVWPTQGGVIAPYGQSAKTESGVHIGGQRGQTVRAAAGGQVVYSGDGLPGYGQLLIIKHNADYLSAYGFNESLLVREGDAVKSGQRIARMGTGPGRRPLLHFEIRRQGKPVDPVRYLPSR